MPQIILITSGSSDFGRAAAEEMAECGHRVFAGMHDPSGINRERANALWAQSIEVIPLEVSDEASVERCVGEVLSRAGRIDVLVNNADPALIQDPGRRTPDQVLAVFNLNVAGMLRMARAVLPRMRRQGSGLIVNVGAAVELVDAQEQALISACDLALEALTDALRRGAIEFDIGMILFVPHPMPPRSKEALWKLNVSRGTAGGRLALREVVEGHEPRRLDAH